LGTGNCGTPTTNSAGSSFTCTLADAQVAGVLQAFVSVGGFDSQLTNVAVVQPYVAQNTTQVVDGTSAHVTIRGHALGNSASVQITLGSAISCTVDSTASDNTWLSCQGSAVIHKSGALVAEVTVSGVSSGPVQVAKINPLITTSTTSSFSAQTGTTVEIYGYGLKGFDSTSFIVSDHTGTQFGCNLVSNTDNSLTCSIAAGGEPITAGAVRAVVSTVQAGVTYSSQSVQVGSIVPVVTAATLNSMVPTDAAITIRGFGFGASIPPVVSLDNGANCTAAVPNAIGQAFLCTITDRPDVAGDLHAVVSVNGLASNSALVSTIHPSVIANSSFVRQRETLWVYSFFSSSFTFLFRSPALPQALSLKFVDTASDPLQLFP